MDNFGARISQLEKDRDMHNQRITIVENNMSDLTDIKDTLEKLARYIKVAAPSIVSAAIAAGLVNGKIGAFLHALIGG